MLENNSHSQLSSDKSDKVDVGRLAESAGNTLPALVDRAASALMSARDSAEVLEARDMARVAYDAAKSAARIVRAKSAHDEIIASVYRAQGHALEIEARAKIRLANEYDAAQDRGEVAGHGGGRNFNVEDPYVEIPPRVGDHNSRRENGPGAGVVDGNAKPTAADIGLRRDEIQDARQLRDADLAEPGIVEKTIAGLAKAGQEPTKAALRNAVDKATGKERVKAKPVEPDEIEALRDENEALRAENDELSERLAEMAEDLEGYMTASEGEVAAATEIKRLKAMLRTVESQRDDWMRQCSQMKKQIKALERRLGKVGGQSGA